MLYWLLEWIQETYNPAGFGLFGFITVRSAAAAFTALIISIFFGRRIIRWLQKMQLKETIRDDIGLDNHLHKAGTPSMGGLIIMISIVIPTLLWMPLDNIYTWLILFVTISLGIVGFVDDYIKIIKKDKQGLLGRFKIAGQVFVGGVLGAFLYF